MLSSKMPCLPSLSPANNLCTHAKAASTASTSVKYERARQIVVIVNALLQKLRRESRVEWSIHAVRPIP
jgi:hypothetical protein